MSASNKPQTKPARPRRLRRFMKRAVLLTLLLVTLAVAAMTYLARSEPAYWKEHRAFIRQSSPEQIDRLAQEVQTQLDTLTNLGITQAKADQFTSGSAGAGQDNVKPEDVRINEDQTLTLTNPQLAAVVQTRLDQWMKERGYVRPKEITDPMVAVDDGKLVMAFELDAGGFTSIISGKFKLTIQDDGMAELSLKRFLVGKLPVPANAIGEHLRKKSGNDERAAKVGDWLEKLQHFKFKPVLELEHRRRARVQDYKLLESGLELTVRIQDHKTYKAMNQALAGVAVD
jgi:hypothetical protein